MRGRWWCPQLGVFVQVDGFEFSSAHTTLWGWPGQNPLRWADPSGHLDPSGWAAYLAAQAADAASASAGLAAGSISGGVAVGLAVAAYPVWIVANEIFDAEHPTVVHGNSDGAGDSCPGADSTTSASPEPQAGAGGAGKRNGGDKPFFNRHGQLTNGTYTIDQAGMDPHLVGSLAGDKSQWLSSVDAVQATLDAAILPISRTCGKETKLKCKPVNISESLEIPAF
jgi:hypothetical protein